MSDLVWCLFAPHLPGPKGQWGRVDRDNRLFINALVWILHISAPWRDLPTDYGDWQDTHCRDCRCATRGRFAAIPPIEMMTEVIGTHHTPPTSIRCVCCTQLRHPPKKPVLNLSCEEQAVMMRAKNALGFLQFFLVIQ
ncbi:transposase [Aeromonas sp. 164P]